MVSVCIATYNGGKHVLRQITSVLSQLSDDDEIIISDDNSSDDTCILINAINDKRIKIFRNKLTPGPVGNFENAIRESKGDFILLADQDDVWMPFKISEMCNALVDNDLVISDCEVVDYNLNLLIPSFFLFRGSKRGFWYNLFKNSYIGCCMGFRREILNYILPFPKNIHMHDWWIGLLVEIYGRIKFINYPLMKYVRHGNNASPTGESSKYGIWEKTKNRGVILYNVVKRWLFLSLQN